MANVPHGAPGAGGDGGDGRYFGLRRAYAEAYDFIWRECEQGDSLVGCTPHSIRTGLDKTEETYYIKAIAAYAYEFSKAGIYTNRPWKDQLGTIGIGFRSILSVLNGCHQFLSHKPYRLYLISNLELDPTYEAADARTHPTLADLIEALKKKVLFASTSEWREKRREIDEAEKAKKARVTPSVYAAQDLAGFGKSIVHAYDTFLVQKQINRIEAAEQYLRKEREESQKEIDDFRKSTAPLSNDVKIPSVDIDKKVREMYLQKKQLPPTTEINEEDFADILKEYTPLVKEQIHKELIRDPAAYDKAKEVLQQVLRGAFLEAYADLRRRRDILTAIKTKYIHHLREVPQGPAQTSNGGNGVVPPPPPPPAPVPQQTGDSEDDGGDGGVDSKSAEGGDTSSDEDGAGASSSSKAPAPESRRKRAAPTPKKSPARRRKRTSQ